MSNNIRTLGSFRNEDSGSDSDGEHPGRPRQQGFYVGGSENSGQEVLGPPRRNGDDVVEQVFNAAREAGARTEDPAAAMGRRRERAARAGVRLDGMAAPVQQEGSGSDDEPELEVRLSMYTNGFTIDDGPLRAYDEPASRQFLETLSRGGVPMELRQMYPDSKIDLRMERKMTEYVPPKAKPFAGGGQRLGAVVPTVVAASSASSSAATPAAPVEKKEDLVAKAQSEVVLEEGAPVTQIQARLPSGARVVGRFNYSHTVQTLRNFIVSAVPDLAFSPFQLMTTFPNKVIEDETLSLKDAGLVNAVVVVKPVA